MKCSPFYLELGTLVPWNHGTGRRGGSWPDTGAATRSACVAWRLPHLACVLFQTWITLYISFVNSRRPSEYYARDTVPMFVRVSGSDYGVLGRPKASVLLNQDWWMRLNWHYSHGLLVKFNYVWSEFSNNKELLASLQAVIARVRRWRDVSAWHECWYRFQYDSIIVIKLLLPSFLPIVLAQNKSSYYDCA